MPALTTTNPMFKKTDVLKLNDAYKLQIKTFSNNYKGRFKVLQYVCFVRVEIRFMLYGYQIVMGLYFMIVLLMEE